MAKSPRNHPWLLATVLAAGISVPSLAADNKLTLRTATGEYRFDVEIADTPESQEKGLMFRESLDDDAGMLFDFDEEVEVTFWMQETLIPLDMIFVGSDGIVESIHANAIPHDTTPIDSTAPVQFVLEIPGGRSVEIGLKPGDTMEHDRVTTP